MCVYHYEDSKRAQCWIFILLLAAILFSFAVAAPMLILTYPGDECLLFVSVRGEALIYGNPAGCNFIAYGHQILILTGKNATKIDANFLRKIKNLKLIFGFKIQAWSN